MFRDGRLPTECECKTVVIIPKRNRDSRGIGLVEVLWKALSGVINWRIGEVVKFYSVIDGFWAGQGIGTAPLEAKLLQNMT